MSLLSATNASRVAINTALNNAIKRKQNQDFDGKLMRKHIRADESKGYAGNEENLYNTMLSKFEALYLMQKMPKEVKQTVQKTKESDEDHLEAIKKVVTRIENLPAKLSLSEIEKFLDDMTVIHLKEAESVFGSNLKRLDRVWWYLLVRDFNILPEGFSSDPRTQYFQEVLRQKNDLFK